MKAESLLDLAEKWERDAKPPESGCTYQDGEEGARQKGMDIGQRYATARCAEELTLLIKLLA